MNKKELIQLTNTLYQLTLLFPKKEPLRYKTREVADDILANLITWEVFHSPNPTELRAVEKNRKLKDLVFEIEKDIKVIDSYFRVAKEQNWVSLAVILDIQEEYAKILCNLKKEIGGRELLDISGQEQKQKTKALLVRESEEGVKEQAQEEPYREEPQLVQTEDRQVIIPASQAPASQKQDSLNFRREKILEILKEKGRAQVGEIKGVFPRVSKRTLRRDFQRLLKEDIIERIGERNDTFYQLIGH